MSAVRFGHIRSRWILSLATPLIAGMTAYSGVFFHLVRSMQGKASPDAFWAETEFLALGGGPLLLGAFILLALWRPRRALALAAVAASALCLIAVLGSPGSLADKAPVLVYLAGVLAHFATLTRTWPPRP